MATGNKRVTSDEAVKMLEKAIRNVNKKYVVIDGTPKTEEKKVQLERCFAYELYHQWSLLIEEFNNKHNPDNPLVLNGEISKKLDDFGTTYPDIVLHGGQDNYANQLLICEIKRLVNRISSPHRSILRDLDKLNQYINFTDIHFKRGVFIAANCDVDQLQKLITKIWKKYRNKCPEIKDIEANRDKIVCIAVSVKDETLLTESKLLSELI